MVAVSLIIPEELHETLSDMSIEQDISISGVIVNLIEKALTPVDKNITKLIDENRSLQARLSFLNEEFEKLLKQHFLNEQMELLQKK